MSTEIAQIESNADLAREVTLGFFDDDALCLRYGITHAQLNSIATAPVFMRLLQDAEKQIAEDGDKFRVKAQKYADNGLIEISKIAEDESIGMGIRLRAVELLCKYAGYDKDANAIAGQGMQIVLQTNLHMGTLMHEDTYTIEVKPEALPSVEDLI